MRSLTGWSPFYFKTVLCVHFGALSFVFFTGGGINSNYSQNSLYLAVSGSVRLRLLSVLRSPQLRWLNFVCKDNGTKHEWNMKIRIRNGSEVMDRFSYLLVNANSMTMFRPTERRGWERGVLSKHSLYIDVSVSERRQNTTRS